MIFAAILDPLARSYTTGTATASAESKPVLAEELGTGTFSRLPFKLSVSASVRGGYDDNVSQRIPIEKAHPLRMPNSASLTSLGARARS
jgi:hypothetical protein